MADNDFESVPRGERSQSSRRRRRRRLLRWAAGMCAATFLAGSIWLVLAIVNYDVADTRQSAEVRFQTALRHAERSNFEAAILELKASLRLHPEYADARWHLAQNYLELGDGAGALKEIEWLKKRRYERDTDLEIGYLQALMLEYREEDVLESLKSARLDQKSPEIRLLKAEALRRLGRVDESAHEYAAVLAVAEDNREARLGLARIALLRNQSAAANNQLDQVLKNAPQDTKALLMKGKLEKSRGNRDAARAYFNEILETNPNDVDARIELARILIAENRLTEADDLMESVGKNPRASFLKGVIAEQLGDSSVAKQHLADAIEQWPRYYDSLIHLGYLNISDGEYGLAEIRLNAADRIIPNRFEVLGPLAQTQLALGRPGDALRTIERGFENYPDEAEAYFVLSQIREARGESRLARAALARVIELDSSHTRARLALGRFAMRDGKIEKALEVATDLKRSKSSVSEGYTLEGEIHLQDNNPEKALASFEQAFANEPSGAMSIARARALRALGRTVEADEVLHEWLHLHPDDWRVRLAYARSAKRRGESTRAIQEYERLVESRNDDVNVLTDLASLYGETGDKRALETARRAAELAPENVQALALYGSLLANNGQLENAIRQFDKALALAPENPTLIHYRDLALAAVSE